MAFCFANDTKKIEPTNPVSSWADDEDEGGHDEGGGGGEPDPPLGRTQLTPLSRKIFKISGFRWSTLGNVGISQNSELSSLANFAKYKISRINR